MESLPKDVLNQIKDMLEPRDYFRVLCVATIFHDSRTETSRKLRKTKSVAVVSQRRLKEFSPKRNKTAYMQFCRDNRQETMLIMKCEGKDVSFLNVTKELANDWYSFPIQKRMSYINMANADRIRYQQEVIRWKRIMK